MPRIRCKRLTILRCPQIVGDDGDGGGVAPRDARVAERLIGRRGPSPGLLAPLLEERGEQEQEVSALT